MNSNESLFLALTVISVVAAFYSICTIMQYTAKFGMTRSERRRLYYVSILIPILGFVCTWPLRKKLRIAAAA